MARILRGVSESTLSDMYSYRDEDAVERVRRSYSEDTRLSDRFRSRMRETHDRLRSERAYQLATAAARRLRNLSREDRIEQLPNIGALQHAKRRNREAIMTSRLLKKARNLGMISGYDDRLEWTPARSNEHADLLARQINNGVYEKHEDGVYRRHNYHLRECRRKEISDYDRGEAMLNRRTVERMVRAGNGEDPTSMYNAYLTSFYA